MPSPLGFLLRHIRLQAVLPLAALMLRVRVAQNKKNWLTLAVLMCFVVTTQAAPVAVAYVAHVQTMESSTRAAVQSKRRLVGYNFPADGVELKTAVDLWISNEDEARVQYADIITWDTGQVTDMSNLFSGHRVGEDGAAAFNANISAWNTASVTNMGAMFDGAAAFNVDISAWDTGRVAAMVFMFRSATAFNANISAWNTGQVTDMTGTFQGAAAFNANISAWNTASVTNMDRMFQGATAFNADIGAWGTASTTTMSGMFDGAWAFNADISAWNTGQVTDMGVMFLSAYAFNANISAWNTASVTTMSRMFESAYAFNADISAWNTASVTTMSRMFESATAFNADISAWNTASVTTMDRMFQGLVLFNKHGIPNTYTAFNADISAWNTAIVTNMDRMFQSATAFNADISAWNTASVTYMSLMFLRAYAFNADISAWNTGLVTDMSDMFESAYAFNADISTWNTGQVTDMGAMFDSAYAFNTDISAWNTGQVTDMSDMFRFATAFNANISAWDTAGVTTMKQMFQSATAFNADISAWGTGQVTDMDYMFEYATTFNHALCWDTTGVTTDNMFDGSFGTTGCVMCAVGQYGGSSASIENSLTCLDCNPGQYAESKGLTDCKKCPGGKFSSASASAGCTQCLPGKFAPASASTCSTCPERQYAKQAESSACGDCQALECASGEYNICGAPTAHASEGGICLPCLPGMFLNDGDGLGQWSTCMGCAPGQYSAAASTQCLACEPGKYQAKGLASFCSECLPGSVTGMGTAAGSMSCTECAAGQYSAVSTVANCIACAAGSITSTGTGAGASTCTECAVGKFSAGLASACSECGAGLFQTAAGRTNCIECSGCPVGGRKSCGGSAEGYCSDCIPGKYASTVNNTCVGCPVGYYQADTSARLCGDCSAGKYQNAEGQAFCDICPSNSEFSKSKKKCMCNQKYYMENDVCRPCPTNSNCDAAGLSLVTLKPAEGFWRATNHHTTFYQCPSIDACPGRAFASNSGRRLDGAGSARDGQCKDGHVGVRCEMCDETNGYVLRADNSCSQCDEGDKKLAIVMLIGLPLVTVTGGVVFVKVLAHFADWKPKADVWHGLQANFDRRSSKIRILIGFTQIVSRMAVTFRVTFPPIVNKFLKWLDMFEFLNIFQFAFIPNCLYTMDYYDQLAGKVLGPTFVLFICYFGFKLTKQRWMYEIFLVLSFVCYPSFCDSLFLFFDCKTYEDGENYLVMYPDIKCTDSKWLSYRYPVAVMGCILPFGIIVLYFIELMGNRRALWPKASTPEELTGDELKCIPRVIIIAADRGQSKTLKAVLTGEEDSGVTKEELTEAFNALERDTGTKHAVEWLRIVIRKARGEAEHLKFLYASYKPQFYWFEAFEMIRKFSLTGLPLLVRLVSQGSNTESVWGTMLTAAFTVYVNSISPYIDDTDQWLSLCAQFHLVTTMIAGMGNVVMKSSDGSEIFVALAVIVPAAVLMAILVYGIIDPEYETWFARKCVLMFRQLVGVTSNVTVLEEASNLEELEVAAKDPVAFFKRIRTASIMYLKPKLVPYLVNQGVEWADVVPVLEAIDSLEELEVVAKDPVAFFERIRTASGSAAKKLAIMPLKPKLVPYLVKQGVGRADVVLVLEAIDSLEELEEEAADNPDGLVAAVKGQTGLSERFAKSSAVTTQRNRKNQVAPAPETPGY
jgi:surface protein